MEKLKHLDLFSGIGGFSLGLERTGGFETVGFCEIDTFCQQILKKHWPHVPIYNDVGNFEHHGAVDIITGGYPCQPFSHAGHRKGGDDDRHLWPEMLNCVQKYRPTWVIGENVIGHVTLGLDCVLSNLADAGYTTETFIIPACAVGAPHRRDRIWIIAHTNRNCQPNGPLDGGARQGELGQDLANTAGQQSAPRNNTPKQGTIGDSQQSKFGGGSGGPLRPSNWDSEPAVGRVVDGVPNRMDRLKSLGNSVVPQIPEILGNFILKTITGATK